METAVADALKTDLTIDITTTGVKSGEPRRIEIWFLHIDARTFITGTPGPRDWVANIRANPTLTFHLKEAITADLDATALVVTNEATRSLVFDHPSASWYRQQTSRADLMVNAPMIEGVFADR